MAWTIGKKFGIIIALITIFVLISTVGSWISGSVIVGLAEKSRIESASFAIKAKDMQVAVIQVQQWLTDISATRGLEGFDDGFAEAKIQADLFYKLHDDFTKMFETKNDKESIDKLNAIKKDFDGFYKMGQEMATIYIKGGPAEGNKMMEKFDPFAAAIGDGIHGFVEAQIAELDGSMVSITSKIKNSRTINLVVSIILVLVIVGVISYIRRSVASSLNQVVELAKRISDNDLTTEVTVDTNDEIAWMAKALNEAVANIKGIMENLKENASILSSSSNELATVSTQMASSAEEVNAQSNAAATASEQVASNVGMVASAAEETNGMVFTIASMTEEMSSTINEVSASVEQTAAEARETAGASEEIASGINTMAAAIEETTASLSEVSKNTIEASRISQNASERTEVINTKMEALVKASTQIGKVVGVIKDIADQTNMLALNATIEAAGAGDAGKGFAVVAGEVKELAKQSAEATDEIAGQIEEIQSSTGEVVGAIEEIGKIINDIAGINQTIAAAVEQQSATVSEISSTAADNAQSVKRVATNADKSANRMTEVDKATTGITTTAMEVAKNVDGLSQNVGAVASSAGEAAQGVDEISRNMRSVNNASQDTASGATQVNSLSDELSAMAKNLAKIVNRFEL